MYSCDLLSLMHQDIDNEDHYIALRDSDIICDVIADYENKHRVLLPSLYSRICSILIGCCSQLSSSGHLKKNILPRFVFQKRIWTNFSQGLLLK